jgi:hypothetical protein
MVSFGFDSEKGSIALVIHTLWRRAKKGFKSLLYINYKHFNLAYMDRPIDRIGY